MNIINPYDKIDGEGSNQSININTYINFNEGAISVNNINIGLPPEVLEWLKKSNNAPTQDVNISELKRAIKVVDEMARENMFKQKKRYFAVYKIIEEYFVKGMTTQNFCDIMEKISELPKEDLPQNDQIRRISCKKESKYPKWEFSTPDDIKLAPIFTSYAKELLDRMGLK